MNVHEPHHWPEVKPYGPDRPRFTGTTEGHLMQDLDRRLFAWLAGKPDARMLVREAANEAKDTR
jgi:hypothetical protein